MKHLALLLLSVLWCLFGKAQVLFEIEAPNALREVYPCMESTDPMWNSPDLSAVGNWFSDTVVIANDGTQARACDSLFSAHQGNFAIFRREHCLLGEQLLNVQSEGATGALVIDSVTGRPLSFGSDSLSSQINIPFVIISKDEGEAIINAINAGDTVVVNIGNKQGQHPVDLGMRMDRALWSSFAMYPYTQYVFTESYFGVWVYNMGTSDMFNISVEFWGDDQINPFSYMSDTVDILSNDSAYFEFDVNPTASVLSVEYLYGYQIHGNFSDEDTLDNQVSTRYLNTYLTNNIISPTFLNDQNFFATETDYSLQVTNAGSLFLGFNFLAGEITCLNNSYAKLQSQDPEVLSNIKEIDNWYTNIFVESMPLYNFSFTNISLGQPDWIEGYHSQFDLLSCDSCAYLAEMYSLDNHLHFTTDMYHDERRRQDSYRRVYLSIDSQNTHFLDLKLTPIQFLTGSPSPTNCHWGIDELSSDAFQLFPNPAVDAFEISSELSVKFVQMITVTGEVIPIQYELATDHYHFNATPGVYLIHITDDQGRTFTKRLLVSN